MNTEGHVPVMLAEVLATLAPQNGAAYLDATFGGGGYASAILQAAPGCTVFAIDRDPDAIARGAALARRFPGRLHLIEGRFGDMLALLRDRGITALDGVVMDLGVSSFQLDQAERGFSFRADGPLDMRMGQDGMTAAEFVNEAEEAEIADIIYRYGEEHRSRRIARSIVAARPIETTAQLATIVRKAVGHKPGAPKDPATRAFQALRIHVNRELDELTDGLEAAERMLKPGGRLAVVTFHSLEDRIVKQFLRRRSGAEAAGSRHVPMVGSDGPAPTFDKADKAVRPSDAELARNPRSRSATLRSATRTHAPAWATGGLAA